ncbi:MAG TPA: AbrB/MazE/SpoVT family DNA-binding domain-containing protein [Candidatus Acidoferrales bacterium]|jgi:AbrB family looped-hinge helix DNA binding protein|nr:AbrB/MazE/SpoVT family DNA-binding domain-containing protein [Candidatus Acidoferrales bacterium]
MTQVTVSPKFQIVIPKELREKLKLRPGQKLFIYELDGSLRLDPPRSIRELRGMAKGIRWEEGDRDHTERL